MRRCRKRRGRRGAGGLRRLGGLDGPRRDLLAAPALATDINVVSLLHHLELAQLELAVGDAFAGLDVVLVAMPRADEVQSRSRRNRGPSTSCRASAAPRPWRWSGPRRPGRLDAGSNCCRRRTPVVPENPDFGIAHEHDAAVAVLELGGLPTSFSRSAILVLLPARRLRDLLAICAFRRVNATRGRAWGGCAAARIPGAARHAMPRCRPVIVRTPASLAVPGLQRITPCCAAPGTHSSAYARA